MLFEKCNKDINFYLGEINSLLEDLGLLHKSIKDTKTITKTFTYDNAENNTIKNNLFMYSYIYNIEETFDRYENDIIIAISKLETFVKDIHQYKSNLNALTSLLYKESYKFVKKTDIIVNFNIIRETIIKFNNYKVTVNKNIDELDNIWFKADYSINSIIEGNLDDLEAIYSGELNEEQVEHLL